MTANIGAVILFVIKRTPFTVLYIEHLSYDKNYVNYEVKKDSGHRMCPQQLFYWGIKVLLDRSGGPQNISFPFLTFVLSASISNLPQAISTCSNCVCLSYWKRFNFQIEILCLQRLDFLHSPLCVCALNHDRIEEF